MTRSSVMAQLQLLLLTYVRLVEGGRLRQRRREFWPEHKVGRGKKAFTMPAGYPAQRDRSARVERTRRLEMLEGVHRFVPMQGGSARAKRRMDRAVGLNGGWGAGGQVEEWRCWRHGWHGVWKWGVEMGCGWGSGVEEDTQAVAEAEAEGEALAEAEGGALAEAETGAEANAEDGTSACTGWQRAQQQRGQQQRRWRRWCRPGRVRQHGQWRLLAGMHTVGRLPIGGYTQRVL